MKRSILALLPTAAFIVHSPASGADFSILSTPVNGLARTYHCRSINSSKPYELCGSTTILVQGLPINGLTNDASGNGLATFNVSCFAVLPYNHMYLHVKTGDTVSMKWKLNDYDFFFAKAGFHMAMDDGDQNNDDVEPREIVGRISVGKVAGLDADGRNRAASAQSTAGAPSASVNHLPVVRYATKRDAQGMVVESIRCVGVDPVIVNSSE